MDDEGGYVEITGHVLPMHGIPDDARMLGLDRNTEEGAVVAMAGSLQATKLSHRVIAWVMLTALIGPSFFGVVHHLF